MGGGRDIPTLMFTPAIAGVGPAMANANRIAPKNSFFILLSPFKQKYIGSAGKVNRTKVAGVTTLILLCQGCCTAHLPDNLFAASTETVQLK
jgi:hypothetical protein